MANFCWQALKKILCCVLDNFNWLCLVKDPVGLPNTKFVQNMYLQKKSQLFLEISQKQFTLDVDPYAFMMIIKNTNLRNIICVASQVNTVYNHKKTTKKTLHQFWTSILVISVIRCKHRQSWEPVLSPCQYQILVCYIIVYTLRSSNLIIAQQFTVGHWTSRKYCTPQIQVQ